MQNWEARCSDCCIGILVGQINYRLVLQVCTAPKPPLCKGRWAADRRLGGVVAGKCSEFALGFGKFVMGTARAVSDRPYINKR